MPSDAVTRGWVSCCFRQAHCLRLPALGRPSECEDWTELTGWQWRPLEGAPRWVGGHTGDPENLYCLPSGCPVWGALMITSSWFPGVPGMPSGVLFLCVAPQHHFTPWNPSRQLQLSICSCAKLQLMPWTSKTWRESHLLSKIALSGYWAVTGRVLNL